MDRPDDLAIYAMPGLLIRRMNQVSVSIFLEECARAGHDLTPVQYAALKAIGCFPGLDQATLAGLIAYDRTTIGSVVGRLADRGLIRREPTPEDRRMRRLTLEPAGTRLLEAVDPIVARIQDEMLVGLEPAERTELCRLLDKAARAANDRSRAPLRPYAEK